MHQCPWIPELVYRFGDLHMFEKILVDAKIADNGKEENDDEIIEAYKYVFSQPGTKDFSTSQYIRTQFTYQLKKQISLKLNDIYL